MHRVLVVALLALSFDTLQERTPELQAHSSAHGPAVEVKLTYLGTAGWEITDGTVVILLDPYLSRIPARTDSLPRQPGEFRPSIDPNSLVVTDTAAVDAHVTRADFILLHHSHFDHIMDVPYIARKTGATVMGHESAINVMRAFDIARDKLITVRGGEDYEFGAFSVRVIPSLHGALSQKHYFDSRVIPPNLRPPLRFGDLAEGGSLSYLIRIGGHEILTFGSANYIEREIQGLRPDVVLVGAANTEEIHDYTGRLMRALGFPALVLPTHWDNYHVPFGASQAANIRGLQSFIEEVHHASPNTRVIIPKYFEPVVLPAMY